MVEADQLVDEPLGVDPAQRVRADVELAGVVADDDGILGYEPRRPSCKAQVDIIRLLLLTGCRTGEILKLRWREVDGDTLELADSKTGPRQVLLRCPSPSCS